MRKKRREKREGGGKRGNKLQRKRNGKTKIVRN